MEQIERLLAEAEQDAVQASDEAMRLLVEFRNDNLLLGFVAKANQFKANIKTLQARLQQIRPLVPSSARNIKIQFLLVQARDTRLEVSRFKENVMEIARND